MPIFSNSDQTGGIPPIFSRHFRSTTHRYRRYEFESEFGAPSQGSHSDCSLPYPAITCLNFVRRLEGQSSLPTYTVFANCRFASRQPCPAMPDDNFVIFGVLGVAVPPSYMVQKTLRTENYYTVPWYVMRVQPPQAFRISTNLAYVSD